jgi:hypothetical protein
MLLLSSCSLNRSGQRLGSGKISRVSSLLAAALAGVLALGSFAGAPLLAAGIVVVQVIFALGAVRQAPITGTGHAGWLALLAGGAAAGWVAVDGIPQLTPMTRVLAGGLLFALVAQLWRRNGRPMLTTSLSLTVGATVLAVLPAAWIALRHADGGSYSVGFGLLGIGLVFLAEALGGRTVLGRTMAVLVAGAAAAAIVLAVDMAGDVPAVSAVVVASFGALMAVAALAAVDRVVSEPSPAAPAPTVSATGAVLEEVAADVRTPLQISLPFLIAAPVVYLLGRILIG